MHVRTGYQTERVQISLHPSSLQFQDGAEAVCLCQQWCRGLWEHSLKQSHSRIVLCCRNRCVYTLPDGRGNGPPLPLRGRFQEVLRTETDSSRAAAHAYGVPETRVHEWRKQKGRIFLSKSTRKGLNKPWRGQFPGIGDELVHFAKTLQVDHMPVMTKMPKVKALELAKHRGWSRSDFKVSRNWISKFLKGKASPFRGQPAHVKNCQGPLRIRLVLFSVMWFPYGGYRGKSTKQTKRHGPSDEE